MRLFMGDDVGAARWAHHQMDPDVAAGMADQPGFDRVVANVAQPRFHPVRPAFEHCGRDLAIADLGAAQPVDGIGKVALLWRPAKIPHPAGV